MLALRAEAGLLPGAAVHLDLDPLDAAVLRPGHTGDGDPARREPRTVARHVDPRLGLDRRPLAPSPAASSRPSARSNRVSSRSTTHFVADT